jgi:glyoxylase-like metal-dependent hydrolase (beta-lactamase superfamily II)
LPGRVLTPDGILIGSCGRADLLSGSAVRQYHALYHTYKSLPDDLEVWPSHDYKGRSHATLGDEKQTNPKLLFGSEEEFVEFMDLENPQAARPSRAPRGGAQGEHDMKEKEWPR